MTLQKLLINHLGPSSLLRRGWVLILLVVGSFAFSPQTRAACDSPDPGCPGANLAEGFLALGGLTTGVYNTGIGTYSLLSLADASLNTGIGAGALFSSNAGQNTAVGAGALFSNTSSVQNVAVGTFALFAETGGANTAVGAGALESFTGSNFNTAVGKDALGNSAGPSGNSNTAVGHQAGAFLTSGAGNVYVGQGVTGVASEDNHTYIRNINTTTVSGGGADFVTVDLASGLLGHATSSRRYKEDVKPMDKASEALYGLKPVTFRYKKEIDRLHALSFGLIAEEVAQVSPDLVARNAEGQPENVRYDQVNAMLLNEFLKEHKKVQDLEATVAQQQKGMEALTAQLKEQAAQIQKVSAQLELKKTAPQTVANK